MADVLFVCVGADAAEAEALAETFENAGFSISDDNVSVESIAGNHVCLIVWSRLAMESPAFNSALAEAIGANKAVIACVSGPDDIALGAPAFDISGWTGDPDDAVLDDLFNAVDRMAPRIETPEETFEPAPAPIVRLVAETPVKRAKPARKKKKRKAHAAFDPMRLGRGRSHLRLVHGALAALLIGGFAFANLAPARSAEPAARIAARIPDETVSLIPGAQNFTIEDLLSDRPLPPMPALAEGIGPVALASPESYDVAPAQPIRPRRAYFAAAETPPASAVRERGKVEATADLVAASSAEATLTPAASMAAATADKAKPHV